MHFNETTTLFPYQKEGEITDKAVGLKQANKSVAKTGVFSREYHDLCDQRLWLYLGITPRLGAIDYFKSIPKKDSQVRHGRFSINKPKLLLNYKGASLRVYCLRESRFKNLSDV
ncbi:hypothetical protein Trydic_g9277 [Trypoxylus dichotomus]